MVSYDVKVSTKPSCLYLLFFVYLLLFFYVTADSKQINRIISHVHELYFLKYVVKSCHKLSTFGSTLLRVIQRLNFEEMLKCY